MRKRFAQNLLFALAANALVKPAYILLVDRAVQVRAGSDAYGRYAALFSLATIFGVVLDFGLAQYATRRLSAAPETIGTELGPLLRARLLLCLLYAATVMAAAYGLGFRSASLGLLGGILVVQTLAQTLLFLRACVASLQRFKTDSLLSILDRTLLIGVMGSLLLGLQDWGGIWIGRFVAAQAACYAVAAGGAAVVLWRASPARLLLGGSRQQVGAVVRGSLPYAALIFLMAVYTRADVLLLERMVSPAEAGRYAAAYRLLDVGNMVGLTVAAILLPLFGRLLADGTSPAPVVRTGASLLLPLSVAASAGALWYGGPVMQMLYPAATPADGRLLSVVMLAFPAFCLSAVYSTLLTATSALRSMIFIALAAALVNLAGNAVLIPRLGAEGTAWMAVATQWMAAVLFTLGVSKRAALPYRGRWIAGHLLFAGIMLACSRSAFWLGLGLPAAAMLIAVIAVAGVLMLRIVSVAEVRRLVQR